TNKVNFDEQMLWYNDRYMGLAYMVQTLKYLALHGSFDSDTAQTLRMCSHNERLRSTRCARQRQAAADDASSLLSVETSLMSRSIPHYTLIAVPEARVQLGVSE